MDRPNAFVGAVLAIIGEIEAAHPEGAIDVRALAELLAEREPMLSPLNLECAAKEALRLAPFVRRARGYGQLHRGP
jgi:hypothetical protein